MSAIETELDRLLDAADAKAKAAERNRRLSRGVFEAHRRKVNPSDHPLRKVRVSFRGEGLTVEALAARALVSERTIRAIETGEPGGSDLTFRRLALALDARRDQIDPSWIAP